MHGRAILGGHLVQLIDEEIAAVGLDHRPGLQRPLALAPVTVPGGGAGEPDPAAALAAGEHTVGGQVGHVFKELRLRHAGIADQQDVDVAPAP